MAFDKTMLSIASLKSFQALPDDLKAEVRSVYFDKMVAPQFGGNTEEAAEAAAEEATEE